MGLPEKIKAIEEEMNKTQIHKHTEHHIGLLKAKLAKLKGELEHSRSSKQSGVGFQPKKSGDCTVVLIGLPSVGKSTILNRVTNAKSKTGSYVFTTLKVVPGVLELPGDGAPETLHPDRVRDPERHRLVRNPDNGPHQPAAGHDL